MFVFQFVQCFLGFIKIRFPCWSVTIIYNQEYYWKARRELYWIYLFYQNKWSARNRFLYKAYELDISEARLTPSLSFDNNLENCICLQIFLNECLRSGLAIRIDKSRFLMCDCCVLTNRKIRNISFLQLSMPTILLIVEFFS